MNPAYGMSVTNPAVSVQLNDEDAYEDIPGKASACLRSANNKYSCNHCCYSPITVCVRGVCVCVKCSNKRTNLVEMENMTLLKAPALQTL